MEFQINDDDTIYWKDNMDECKVYYTDYHDDDDNDDDEFITNDKKKELIKNLDKDCKTGDLLIIRGKLSRFQ